MCFFWNFWLNKLKIDYEFAWSTYKSSICVAFHRFFFSKRIFIYQGVLRSKINLILYIFQGTLWSALSMLEYIKNWIFWNIFKSSFLGSLQSISSSAFDFNVLQWFSTADTRYPIFYNKSWWTMNKSYNKNWFFFRVNIYLFYWYTVNVNEYFLS